MSDKKSLAIALSTQKHNKKKPMAKVAQPDVAPSDIMSDDERASSVADAIMRKRKKMADGGMVDLNDASEEEARSPYDDINAETGDKEAYDLDQLSAQPMGSNEHGDDIDSDKHDMVSAIRAKLKAKRGF